MPAEQTDTQTSQVILYRSFPEMGAGGFTSRDGTIEFYTRVNALLSPQEVVLVFGAGRGVALSEGRSAYKRRLMRLQEADEPLPFADESFNLIVSDFVFEHIADPASVSTELRRILKPGGWICARTPNKYCLVSLATRLIRNSWHASLLRWVQPERKATDVFPTAFQLNSLREIRKWFPSEVFENYTYRYEAEPSYFFNSRLVFALMLQINHLSPPVLKSNLFVFLRKK